MSGRQLALGLELRPALGREDLLVTAGNADAVAWIDRWPDWPGIGLVIHGAEGCGKTHLAEVWRAKSAAKRTSLSDLPRLVRCLQTEPETGAAFVVEDIDAAADERSFLHFINTLHEGGGSLLLTARRPAARWSVALADLRSRLRSLPAIAVRAPDEATLRAVLAKLFADRQLQVDEPLVAFLCLRIERTFQAARETVAALDAAALATRRKVNVALAREVLGTSGREG